MTGVAGLRANNSRSEEPMRPILYGTSLAQTACSEVRSGKGDPNNETYLVSGVVFHFLRFARWMYGGARPPHNIPTLRGL
jgi:hypothetical protein